MKKFINPREIPVIPGTEGWERMYPYYYRFVPKGIDSKMEEYEDSQFWFVDNLHQTDVLLPFETIVDDAWWPSLNQISSRIVCFPNSRGLDHRMLNGWVYLCSPEETDPEVIAAKAAVVGDRMNYYFQNWDELLPVWKKKQYDNAKELDSISFDKLPDIISDAYVRKNLGYSPAHVMRTDYFKLLKVVDLCWEQHFELFNVGLAAYLSFSDLCKTLFPDITDKTIGMMVASGAAMDSYLPEYKLEELARLAIELGLENHILKEGNADEVEARLAESEAGRKWQSERDKFRDPYFYVGTGYSVVTHKDKCWNDDWNIPLAILREFIGQIIRGEFVRRDIDARKREADALVEQYRSVLDEKEKGMFDQLLPLARRGADHAESHMFWGETQYQPRQFNKLRQLGELFCKYDMMDEPNDLFYFNRWEIPSLIQDLTNAWSTRTRPAATWHIKPELAWRKGVIRKFREWEAPPFLGKPQEKVSDPFTIGLWGITTDSVQNYLEGGEIKPEDVTELKGFQASPGVIEGRARVLTSHHDIDQIEKGEILVVTLTSPTWGPAFAKIAACITDIGGMMSHAAIICREYGIPAVIGTGYATKAIKTGDLIKVDGDKGVIKIVERNNA